MHVGSPVIGQHAPRVLTNSPGGQCVERRSPFLLLETVLWGMSDESSGRVFLRAGLTPPQVTLQEECWFGFKNTPE